MTPYSSSARLLGWQCTASSAPALVHFLEEWPLAFEHMSIPPPPQKKPCLFIEMWVVTDHYSGQLLVANPLDFVVKFCMDSLATG